MKFKDFANLLEEKNLTEVLSKSAPIEDWIHDFVHSDNPKFKGKTKEERRKMAIAAYYAAHSKSRNESIEVQVENILNELNYDKMTQELGTRQTQLEPHMQPGEEYADLAKNLHTKYGELVKKIASHKEKMAAIKRKSNTQQLNQS